MNGSPRLISFWFARAESFCEPTTFLIENISCRIYTSALLRPEFLVVAQPRWENAIVAPPPVPGGSVVGLPLHLLLLRGHEYYHRKTETCLLPGRSCSLLCHFLCLPTQTCLQEDVISLDPASYSWWRMYWQRSPLSLFPVLYFCLAERLAKRSQAKHPSTLGFTGIW